MKPNEPMTPEDRELRQALESMSEPLEDHAEAAPIRRALESFREKLAGHPYARAIDPAGAAKMDPMDAPTQVRSEESPPYHRPRPRMTVALLLFDDLVALDAVGPYEVLGVLGGVDFKFVAKKKGPLRAARGGLGLIADTSLNEVESADMLLVPGGPGAEAIQRDPEVLDWVRRMHANATWTCSACTGSLILAAAGILEGKRATTHWASLDRLADYGAIAVRERVVVEDGLVTGAGVSAGIDLGLVVAALLRGEEAAQTVQLHLEYDPHPPFDAGSPGTAPAHIRDRILARLGAVRRAADEPTLPEPHF